MLGVKLETDPLKSMGLKGVLANFYVPLASAYLL